MRFYRVLQGSTGFYEVRSRFYKVRSGFYKVRSGFSERF